MKKRSIVAVVVTFTLTFCVAVRAQSLPIIEGVTWNRGPTTGSLGNMAELQVPKGYVFVGASGTKVLMEEMQNPVSGTEIGFVAPESFDWFVVFEFDDIGYVRDDDKNSLDADAVLRSIRRSTEAGNKERRERGWPTMTIVGWEQTPHYSEATNYLEWAIEGESEGESIINYNTRLLGRRGVMRVTLVTDPTALAPTLPRYRELLAGFDFKQGHQYSEFRQGDKIAGYGLTALIVGGVATKTGLLRRLWKVIAAGGVAIAAFLKNLFSGKGKKR